MERTNIAVPMLVWMSECAERVKILKVGSICESIKHERRGRCDKRVGKEEKGFGYIRFG